MKEENRWWRIIKRAVLILSLGMNLIFILGATIIILNVPRIIDEFLLPIVGGMNQSFSEMNDASIIQTISIRDEIPIAFSFPLEQQTDVVLATDVILRAPATITLPGAPDDAEPLAFEANIVIPQDTVLPVKMALDIPVDALIPVALDVPVAIPLDETELSTPLARLAAIFSPSGAFILQLSNQFSNEPTDPILTE